MMSQMNSHEMELLNAYLDHEMTDQELLSFAESLAQNHLLKDELNELLQVKQKLSSLPQHKPPRNYILTRAEAAAARRPNLLERLFPAFRTAAVFACFALMFTFLIPWLSFSTQNAAPQTVYLEKSVNDLGLIEGADVQEQANTADMPASTSLRDLGITEDLTQQPSQGFRGGSPKLEYLVSVERVKPDSYLGDSPELMDTTTTSAFLPAENSESLSTTALMNEAEVQKLINEPLSSPSTIAVTHLQIAQIVLAAFLAVCLVWIALTLVRRRLPN